MKETTKKFVVNRINCPATVAQALKENRYVYVGRPSKWGNRYVVGRDGTRTECLEKYKADLLGNVELMSALHELRGRMLGCSCLPLPCHAEILAELANSPSLICASVSAPESLEHFVQEVEGVCKCGKKFSVGHHAPTGEPVILHELPECKEFVRLDLVDFLRWNRNARDN